MYPVRLPAAVEKPGSPGTALICVPDRWFGKRLTVEGIFYDAVQ
jgi:hypothetical protein